MKWSVPHVHPSRLRRAPAVRVIERGEHAATFAVEGLVCGLCAGRARSALASVAGVRGVEVDLERGVAVVEHGGEAPPVTSLQGALDRVVVALPLRRLLDRLTHRGERTTA